MSKELIQSLLEAGVHFGHQTKKWNPKMKPFIFGEKNGVHIIDLEKTADHLTRACNFLREVASQGSPILFVGTKTQAQEIIRQEAQRCNMFFVSNRWLGGMLTNYSTVRNSVRRYKQLIQMREDGTFEALTKKEIAEIEKEITKLEKNLAGVAEMTRLPGAVFIVDEKKEGIAVKEANRLGIPVVAIVDTDSDPNAVQYPIPGNDDAIRSVKLLTSIVVDSILEGQQKYQKNAESKKNNSKNSPEEVTSMAEGAKD
ncbi:MAG TPA: 30S ribosomal protein S2 [Candidatus Omnitrophota bacterium]|nr:30S ribosomal protein S2 [Candidatus Omnitrophota bacterium]